MRLTIRMKLIGNLLLLLLLMGAISLVSVTQFNTVAREAQKMYETDFGTLQAIAKTRFNLSLVRTNAALVTTYADPQEIQQTVDAGHQAEKTALEGLATFKSLGTSAEDQEHAQKLEATVKTYLDAKEITLQLALKGDQPGARENMQNNAKGKFKDMIAVVNEVFESEEGHARHTYEGIKKTVHTGQVLNIGSLILAIIVGLTGGLLLANSIGSNIRSVAAAVDRVAQGDLSQELEVKTNDELGDMTKSVQQMIHNLRTIVSQVHHAANNVAAGTEQISASTEQMSKTAQSQASATDETSSSIAEIASTIQMVASNVTSANEVAIQAFDSAQLGSKTVDQTIKGMAHLSETIGEVTVTIERLGQSSAQIGAIVELIGDIAKQTNLLALNATIEAARAGENGRGFAVVADEVRQLAKRSTEATSNISELIRGIQTEMARAVESTRQGEQALQDGTQLAQEAGQSLSAIVSSVEQVRSWMEQIHRATQEQGQASDQIVNASEHLNSSTRESTIAIGQISDSATSLQSQGRELLGAIAFFEKK